MTKRQGIGPAFSLCFLFLISLMSMLWERNQLQGILQQISVAKNPVSSIGDMKKSSVLPDSELLFRFDNSVTAHDDSVDEDANESPFDAMIRESEDDAENTFANTPSELEEIPKTISKGEIMERLKTAMNNGAQTTSALPPKDVEMKQINHHDLIEKAINKTRIANATQQESENKWNRNMWKSLSEHSSRNIVQVDDLHEGEIMNGQLVVNVDQTYMFWDNGQRKLCELLRNMTLADNWDVPKFLNDQSDSLKPPLLNVAMNCTDETRREGKGQGNWVTAVYMTRLAAAKARADFQFQCSDDDDDVKMKLLLPWFQGRFDAPNASHPWPYSGNIPSQDEACTTAYPRIRIDKLADQITDAVRKMAVTLVGSRDETRVHPQVPGDQDPLIPNVELDDVVIHFRCGDVMGGARRGDFGMIKFTEYKRWISPDAKTIGILTQPFDPSRNRRLDIRRIHYCRNATYTLVETLQETHPDAIITIRNGPNETLPLAYARLVMANQSFTTLSSFGIFPIIGTFGQGYFQRGNRGINPFANYLPAIMPNLHMMTAEVLTTGAMWKMNLTSILDWLTSPTEDEVGTTRS